MWATDSIAVNTAAATACIINTGETFMFTVRGKEPAQGKLALPGGFVNPGEGAIDGLRLLQDSSRFFYIPP
ncbi:MAG: hypothetical protein LBT14_10110 [Treponema sp.]|nr:hypothetical protein [Treponema sp.]